MNIFAVAYCRSYQFVLSVAVRFLNFKEPELIAGEGSSAQVPALLKKHGYLHPLIVADPGVVALGLAQKLEDSLKAAGYAYAIYDGVIPNPTFDCIYEAKALALKNNCDSIVAIGGGSAIDTAKAVGALLANRHATLNSLRGLLRVRRRYKMLIAIPTTAGTGSEATVAAVVVNPKTHEKFAINDPKLIPEIAIHDSALLAGLPPKLIATTGMDALTHAVEAYIGHCRTAKTKRYCLEAVRLIADNLVPFYATPSDAKARLNMQRASYLAGVAFTRSYVGYVHALAHALGGEYNVPHGFANAVILPHILRRYGKKAEKPLARLSEALTLTPYNASRPEKAAAFIRWVEAMNAKMGIPKTFDHLIKPEDIPLLAQRAAKEANPFYPVPLELSSKELQEIDKEIDPQ